MLKQVASGAASGGREGYPASFYAASAHPAPDRPALSGPVTADVCVIGGGYSGLSAALHLVERGYDVVVIEGERIGWGASGRNGGQIVNGYSRDIDVIEKRYGVRAAEALGRMACEGGDIIRERIARYEIACDHKPGGILAAFTSRHLREMDASRKRWQARGRNDLEMLDATGIRQHVGTDAYLGGRLDPRSGHIHPLNLALGEAAAIEKLGGRIFENSRASGLEHIAGRPVVRTAQGSVTARFVVVCGNAYLGAAVPELSSRVMPVSTQVLATEPLGDARAAAILPSDLCIEDARYVLDYYRLTADKRLLFGGGIVYGGATPSDIVARLRPHLLRLFPELADLALPYAWSGNFALTLTRIPQLGRIGNDIYFAHGYSGHGVTTSHLAGRLIAEAMDGDASRFDSFAGLPYIAFPGGRLLRVPLTMLGAWWYGLRDRIGV